MELIKQYSSDTESDTEQEEEQVPLPTIEIYSQKYQQNMRFKGFATYCFLPSNPSITTVSKIEKGCRHALALIPQLVQNYRFVSPHKDRIRDIKQHITLFPNTMIPSDERFDTVATGLIDDIRKLPVPESLVTEVGGDKGIAKILNKRRKVLRFELEDHFKLRRGQNDRMIFLGLDIKFTPESQKYIRSLTQMCHDHIIGDGKESCFMDHHISVSNGYLKKHRISMENIDEFNEKLKGLKLPEMEGLYMDIEEFRMSRVLQNDPNNYIVHRLLNN